MPTSGAAISACMASKATTIGNVAGAGSPARYGVPVAAAKAASRSSVTSSPGVGGNVRPDSDGSTAMAGTLPGQHEGRLPHWENRPVAGEPSAGLAVVGVLAATRAELLQLHAVRVVAAVLLRDVVAF